jgi:hypothetical protein
MRARSGKEHRWCDRHHYFIDLDACEARADQSPRCRRCIHQWNQLCLPLPEFLNPPAALPRGGARTGKNGLR